MKSLRILIWVYFYLLIFEGALRKWILPEYSNVLLLVRDPLLFIIYLRAIFLQVFPRNLWMDTLLAMAGLFGLLGWVQLASGTPLWSIGVAGTLKASVVIFGWRTYFLHLPLIFLMPVVLTFDDMKLFTRTMVVLGIPMTLLVVAQYLAPSDAWINSAAKGGEQLAYVGEKIRAPGTFSFNTGPACFYALLAACGGAVLLGSIPVQRWMGWVAIVCSVIYAPIGGGRLNIGMVAIVLLAGVFLSLIRMGIGQLKIIVVTAVVIVAVTYTPIFRDGLDSMMTRLDSAASYENEEYEYGFMGRMMSGFAVPYTYLRDQEPLFVGKGIGLGTVGGAKLQTGDPGFLLGESEWDRTLHETGWAWGMLYLIWRVGLTLWLLVMSFRANRRGNVFPILLWSANVWTMLQGQWGQTTNLGFAVWLAGLNLAACYADLVFFAPDPTKEMPPGLPPEALARPFGRQRVLPVRVRRN